MRAQLDLPRAAHPHHGVLVAVVLQRSPPAWRYLEVPHLEHRGLPPADRAIATRVVGAERGGGGRGVRD